MVSMNIHYLTLNEQPYNLIKSQKKVVELRLYDERRQKIQIGDIITFSKKDSNESISAKVLKLHLYKDFVDLFNNIDKAKLGYNEAQIADPTDMEIYYSKENISLYGVIVIELSLIKEKAE